MRKWVPPYQNIFRKTVFSTMLFWLLSVHTAFAGPGIDTFAFYVAPNATIFVGGNTQMSLFNNVTHSGSFGSGQGSVVHFFGDLWKNTAGATLPDASGGFSGIGGKFRFANTIFPQYISGAFSVSSRTGTSFPSLWVANPVGVYLQDNLDIQVRDTLQFDKGVLWLMGNNILVGTNNPGNITGYSATSFVGTDNRVTGGYLYRSKVTGASGNIVFPIGSQVGSYAPFSIMYNSGTGQDIHARVFDDIYSKAVTGTRGSIASVQQTWNVGQENATAVPAIVALQHTFQREGSYFTIHRGNSFITMFDVAKNNWDTVGPSGVTSPGTLTTGTPQNGTYVNTRALLSLSQNTFLSKTTERVADSLTIAKGALFAPRQSDGSYLVTYVFLISNVGILPASNLHVFDTLTNVFKAPSTFSVTSVTATGNLSANSSFDGSSVTDLLTPVSTLAPLKTDTVTLVLNVKPVSSGTYFYNSATVQGTLTDPNNNTYVFSNRSVNGMDAPAPGSPALPTPLVLSPPKYKMPEGFSPNGDGVNDKMIIGNLGPNDKVEVYIFSKDGRLVYRNLNYQNDWDGTYNQNQGGQSANRKVEDGTYFYKIIVTDAAAGKPDTYYGYLSIWK